MYPNVRAHAQTRKRYSGNVQTTPRRVVAYLFLLSTVAVIAWALVPVLPDSVYIAAAFVVAVTVLLHITRGGAR